MRVCWDPPLKQRFSDQKFFFPKIDTFSDFRRYWKCVNLWETTVYSWTTVESIFLTSSKHGFIAFSLFESGSTFFQRNWVMWSFISKSNFAWSKAERHANASRDYFFLNLNSIKKLSTRSDFGRKISWGFDIK